MKVVATNQLEVDSFQFFLLVQPYDNTHTSPTIRVKKWTITTLIIRKMTDDFNFFGTI